MRNNFEKSLTLVLAHEGGYVNDPRDPGGATNKGVTIATFRYHFGAHRTIDDLKHITDEQVRYIYRVGYWDGSRCDDLPGGLDYVVFDGAVNSGPSRSIMWLQNALSTTEDGVIGPKTLAALVERDVKELITQVCLTRRMFLQDLGNWRVYGNGWTRRVKRVEADAIGMVG